MTKNTDDLKLVWGVKAISELIGRSERQTYDMCVAGHLPVRQVGTRWVAKRAAIERFFEETAA